MRLGRVKSGMNILACAAILYLVVGFVGCQEKFVSCSQISSYCSAQGRGVTSNDGQSSLLQSVGRPGKAGAKGSKGEIGAQGPIGPPGLPGEVDEAAIEARILTKVKAMMSNCRLIYNDSCFFVVGNPSNKYGKEDFQRMCEDRGAHLANLYGEDHRLKLSQYVRSETTAGYVEVALGMTYQHPTATFFKDSGDTFRVEALWHPTYPKSTPGYFLMYLAVRATAAEANQGIFNYHAAHSVPFALCEYDIAV